MSREDLNQFAQKIGTDADLQEALKQRFDDLGNVPADDLISFAQDQGYSFTVDEIREELTEEELEGVTGGTTLDKSSPLLSSSLDSYALKFEYETQTFNFKFY